MNEQESREHLVDILASALDERVSFVMMGAMFPSEARKKSVAAFKRLGYKQAAEMLESITGEHSRSRLCD